jgi:RimJ/RimL family protein N-acetyltransferase
MIYECGGLEGRHVRLAPLSLDHAERLAEIGCVEDLWLWTTVKLTTPENMRQAIEAACRARECGSEIPFATVERASGLAVGSTRFLNITPEHRRVEIGWTWLAPAWQRTALNTEAKYLMLRQAFDVWGCIRVELKTNALNLRSRAAILRIGAKEEGTLRRHMINDDGTVRDTVYFSITDSEWPGVRSRIEAMLGD